MEEARREGRGRWRRALEALLLCLASSAATVLALEAGLRLLHPVPFSMEVNMYFEPDPYTGFRMKPLSHGFFFNDAPADANRWGLRDDDVPLPRTSGTTRILVLGDSFTVGASVRQEEAYPQVLERTLKAEGRAVEVIDAGIGGYGPFQYDAWFEHYGVPFKPDLVVVGFFVGNDTYDEEQSVDDLPTAVRGRRIDRKKAARLPVDAMVWCYEHSHLARLLLNRGPVRGEVHRARCSDFTRQYLAIQQSRLPNHRPPSPARRALAARNVDHLRHVRDLGGVPVLVVLIPDENQINPALRQRLLQGKDARAYDFEHPQAMLRPMIRAAGLEVLDLLEPIRGDGRCLYMNDTHWTPAGHALAAEAIAARVRPRTHAIPTKLSSFSRAPSVVAHSVPERACRRVHAVSTGSASLATWRSRAVRTPRSASRLSSAREARSRSAHGSAWQSFQKGPSAPQVALYAVTW